MLNILKGFKCFTHTWMEEPQKWSTNCCNNLNSSETSVNITLWYILIRSIGTPQIQFLWDFSELTQDRRVIPEMKFSQLLVVCVMLPIYCWTGNKKVFDFSLDNDREPDNNKSFTHASLEKDNLPQAFTAFMTERWEFQLSNLDWHELARIG